jgi:multicomponent Na+:H+ antiporter subunit B
VSVAGRRAMFLAGAAGLGALLAWGLAGLPAFGASISEYARVLNQVAGSERHVTEVVGAVVMDYRGFDTLGEEFILFASAAGVAMLLRAGRGEEEHEPSEEAEARATLVTSDAIRVVSLGLAAPTVLLGLAIVAHGHVTPGGGFQGGAILATASTLVFLSGRFLAFRRINPLNVIDAAEGIGVGGMVLVGLAGVIAGGGFLQNVLPLGTSGDLLSGGTIPVLNLSVGLAVFAAFVLILSEFLEQSLMVHRKRR